MFQKIKQLLNLSETIKNLIDETRRGIAYDVNRAISYAQAAREEDLAKQTVVALVQANYNEILTNNPPQNYRDQALELGQPIVKTTRITLAKKIVLSKGKRDVITIQPDVALHHGQLILICDIDRVKIGTILIGNRILTASLSNCPIAYFDKFETAEILRIQVENQND